MGKALMKYHPRLGYTYMPGSKLRVPGVNGGYLVRTNEAGFRSDREFSVTPKASVFRALLFGDSQTAGDGMSNAQRFSDLMEAAVPGLEIDNYALSGSSTDQHYLIYRERAPASHDLVIIGLNVENILRVKRRIVKARDTEGLEIFRAKPYYELDDDRLTLHNIPVPKQPWTAETLPVDLLPHVYSYGEANFFFRNHSRRHGTLMRALAPFGPLRHLAKQVLTRLRKFQPLPDYDTPSSPAWRLLREILKSWIKESKAPVLIVLLPLDSALSGLSDPAGYQTRFRELAAETGCHLFDPLPELLQLSTNERRSFWSESYGHLSPDGHAAIARLLAPVVQRFMQQVR